MKATRVNLRKKLAVLLFTAGMAIGFAGTAQAYFTTLETSRVGTNVQAGVDSEINNAIVFKLIDETKTGAASSIKPGSYGSCWSGTDTQPIWLKDSAYYGYNTLIFLNGITNIGPDTAGSKYRRATYSPTEPCLNDYRIIFIPKTVTTIAQTAFYLSTVSSESFSTDVFYGGTQAEWTAMKSSGKIEDGGWNNKILGGTNVNATVKCLGYGSETFSLWDAPSYELDLGSYNRKAAYTLAALANSSSSKVTGPTDYKTGTFYCEYDMDGDGSMDLKASYISSSTKAFLEMLDTCSLSGKHTYTLDNEALDWALLNRAEHYESITIDFGFNLSKLKPGDVTIPSVTYTGSAVVPTPVVKFGGEELTTFRVQAKDNINAGTNSATLTLLPPVVNSKGVFSAWSSVFSILPADLSEVNASAANVTWPVTTSALTAAFNGKTLVKDTDYALTYIGGAAGPAIARMTGKGNFKGTKDVSFTIEKANIGSASVTAPNATYNGSEQKPAPAVKLGSTTLSSADYSVAYSNNKNAGTATVTVTGEGNYTGKASGTFTIGKASLKGASVSAAAQTYTGSVLLPTPAVKLGGVSLVKDTDYVASYSSNTNVGKATITITGKGNYSDQDSASGSFDIVAKSLAGAVVTVNPAAYDYTGAAITPAPVVTLGGKILKNGTDYTVSYSGNINAGTAAITVSGKGNYTGKASGGFTITKKEQPAPAAQPAQSAEPAPAAQPAQSTEPAPAAQPAQSAEPAPSTQPAQSAEPAPSTEPAVITEPAPAAANAAYAPEAVTPQNPAKLAQVQKTILGVKDDTKDVKGSTYSLLKAKGVPLSKTSVRLTWSKVPGASKYIIYGNKCGKKNKYVKITSVKKSKTSYTRKKLTKGTYYKFMVVAVKGKDVLATSKTIHVATKGGKGKKGNPTAITLNKKSIKVKVGKTYRKLKATVKSGTLKAATHRKAAWESSDISIAKVNSKGRVTGVSKGTCYVYAYAQNGLAARVKVKVN